MRRRIKKLETLVLSIGCLIVLVLVVMPRAAPHLADLLAYTPKEVSHEVIGWCVVSAVGCMVVWLVLRTIRAGVGALVRWWR